MTMKRQGIRRPCRGLSLRLIVLLAICANVGCESGGLFGPSANVDGTWTGTFMFGAITADVTATLSESATEDDVVTGSFTATRSNPETGSSSDTDGGSVTGTIGAGIGMPTVTLTFESTKYCDWTLTAILDDETITGTWSTAVGCATASSGSATLTRS